MTKVPGSGSFRIADPGPSDPGVDLGGLASSFRERDAAVQGQFSALKEINQAFKAQEDKTNLNAKETAAIKAFKQFENDRLTDTDFASFDSKFEAFKTKTQKDLAAMPGSSHVNRAFNDSYERLSVTSQFNTKTLGRTKQISHAKAVLADSGDTISSSAAQAALSGNIPEQKRLIKTYTDMVEEDFDNGLITDLERQATKELFLQKEETTRAQLLIKEAPEIAATELLDKTKYPNLDDTVRLRLQSQALTVHNQQEVKKDREVTAAQNNNANDMMSRALDPNTDNPLTVDEVREAAKKGGVDTTVRSDDPRTPEVDESGTFEDDVKTAKLGISANDRVTLERVLFAKIRGDEADAISISLSDETTRIINGGPRRNEAEIRALFPGDSKQAAAARAQLTRAVATMDKLDKAIEDGDQVAQVRLQAALDLLEVPPGAPEQSYTDIIDKVDNSGLDQKDRDDIKRETLSLIQRRRSANRATTERLERKQAELVTTQALGMTMAITNGGPIPTENEIGRAFPGSDLASTRARAAVNSAAVQAQKIEAAKIRGDESTRVALDSKLKAANIPPTFTEGGNDDLYQAIIDGIADNETMNQREKDIATGQTLEVIKRRKAENAASIRAQQTDTFAIISAQIDAKPETVDMSTLQSLAFSNRITETQFRAAKLNRQTRLKEKGKLEVSTNAEKLEFRILTGDITTMAPLTQARDLNRLNSAQGIDQSSMNTLIRTLNTATAAQRKQERDLFRFRAKGGSGFNRLNADDRDAVDAGFTMDFTAMVEQRERLNGGKSLSSDEVSGLLVNFVAKTGVVPTSIKNDLQGRMDSNDRAQMAGAANTIGAMIQANPNLNTAFTDDQRLKVEMMNRLTSVGVSAEAAADAVIAQTTGINNAEFKVRDDRWKDDEEPENLADDLKSAHESGIFGHGADKIPDQLMGDALAAGKALHRKSGDAAAAKKTVIEGLTSKWAVTNVGGVSRWQKNAPEAKYGQFPGNRGKDSAWIQDQMIEEVLSIGRTDDLGHVNVTEEQLRGATLEVNPLTSRNPLPEYFVMINGEAIEHPDGGLVTFRPDWNTSKRKEIDDGINTFKTGEAAAALRSDREALARFREVAPAAQKRLLIPRKGTGTNNEALDRLRAKERISRIPGEKTLSEPGGGS